MNNYFGFISNLVIYVRVRKFDFYPRKSISIWLYVGKVQCKSGRWFGGPILQKHRWHC